MLHGGPGGSALAIAPAGLATLETLDHRDVITFDQRGAGRSLPSLNCPEKEEAILVTLGAVASFESELELNRKAVTDCRKRLERSGVDLDDYDTPSSVADMESIRVAFDVDTWNVFGGSYGTRLGLAYARANPHRVRSLLLCTDDPACHAAYGDLGALIDQAADSFDADPEVLDGTFAHNGEVLTRQFTLTGPDIRGGLFSALYQTGLIPLLPAVSPSTAPIRRGSPRAGK